MMIIKKTKWLTLDDLLFCGSIAAFFLLLTTTSSPLYPMNTWVDANSFMTMGKGMFNGLVPYRDLFEQKGPLLYLIHGLSWLIDNTGFFGVYLFEVISLTITLILASKLVRLFVAPMYSYLIIPVFACLPLLSRNFDNGGSAEEFSFALIMGVFYLMARHFKQTEPQPMNSWTALLLGFLAGCIFMIKYTMLGLWIGLAIVLAVDCIGRRKFAELLRIAGFFICGIVLAWIPWQIYFGLNHAIDDFFYTYIYVNLTCYQADLTLFQSIRLTGGTLLWGFNNNLIAALLTLFGLTAFSFRTSPFRKGIFRFGLPICFVTLIITTYYGGHDFGYYLLALFPFLIFGLIAVAAAISRRRELKFNRKHMAALLICGILVLTVATVSYSPNIPIASQSRKDLPQYRFAAIINQVPGATLLNYGFLDGGFYTAANITPTFKYFMLNNISYSRYPEMRDEQDRYIRERLATFVVLRMSTETGADTYPAARLQENYDLVDEMSYNYINSGQKFRFALYKVKN